MIVLSEPVIGIVGMRNHGPQPSTVQILNSLHSRTHNALHGAFNPQGGLIPQHRRRTATPVIVDYYLLSPFQLPALQVIHPHQVSHQRIHLRIYHLWF